MQRTKKMVSEKPLTVRDVLHEADRYYFPFPDIPAEVTHAVLPVDKPAGWSSFDVIRRLRRILKERKIGHAGTLDPMATGLLLCCVGRMTKQVDRLMVLPKTYDGTLRLGQVTASYDAESKVVAEHPWLEIGVDEVAGASRALTGAIHQVPPMYSAVKIGGERLYRKARRGEVVEREPRPVMIHEFELLDFRLPEIDFRVVCSKGTYVRSLVHDLGMSLGCGAHLTALRRTASGPFYVDRAWKLEELAHEFTGGASS